MTGRNDLHKAVSKEGCLTERGRQEQEKESMNYRCQGCRDISSDDGRRNKGEKRNKQKYFVWDEWAELVKHVTNVQSSSKNRSTSCTDSSITETDHSNPSNPVIYTEFHIVHINPPP